LAYQVERVTVIEGLAEDQDASAGLGPANLQRRPPPVISVIRRHLDVGDHHVRVVSTGVPH
jgi:hypothetical protein